MSSSRPETPSRLDKEALLAALRAGDDRAYEQMVRAFGGLLLAVARRILRHEDDAGDATQRGICPRSGSILVKRDIEEISNGEVAQRSASRPTP